jgi:tRNA A-37 threonylcarbamoyl transferase component Bud32
VPACAHCGATLEAQARFCTTCGEARSGPSATAILADPVLGRVVVDKYRVEEMLGEGGMGRVYRATQVSLDKTICLKLLRKELADDPETKARFHREARAASRLNHPNSIQVIDFGSSAQGELYLAMEYVRGRDLQQVLTTDFPLDEARVRHVMAQVLDALAEAHDQRVIHRDLKPENIMLTRHREDPDWVKVLDFGIAQIQESGPTQARLTRAGLVCGTPEYMSPEQARGEPLDARSDLYSAGVILYHLATGSLPFQADTPLGFVAKHLTEIPAAPRTRRPEVSTGLSDLILKSMQKDPAQRFESATAMRAALLELGPSGAVGQNRRWLGGRRGLALVLGLVLVAGGAGYASHRMSSRTPAPSPQSAAAAARAEEAQRYMATADKLFFDNQLDEALKNYERAAHADPQFSAPLKKLGICYQRMGDSKRAVEHLQRYVDWIPTPPDADSIRKIIASLNPP